jgi:hypothetical protein
MPPAALLTSCARRPMGAISYPLLQALQPLYIKLLPRFTKLLLAMPAYNVSPDLCTNPSCCTLQALPNVTASWYSGVTTYDYTAPGPNLSNAAMFEFAQVRPIWSAPLNASHSASCTIPYHITACSSLMSCVSGAADNLALTTC